ncbi:MAG: RNA polymerase sigma factor [Actinomycetota bacterium]
MEVPEPAVDQDLVIAARLGDPAARETLGARASRDAYVFALQLTGDRDSARDLAQDAVLRFFRRLDSFDESRRIEPWLFQIVRNLVRDRARRRVHRRHVPLDEHLDDVDGRVPTHQPGPDPLLAVERTLLQERIWSAVRQLSDDHREIFVLRDHHQLSYREIATILSIPEGTVMSRLHAARKRLRSLLADDVDGTSP